MNLNELINECIRIKPGNKEFALFYLGDCAWTAEIGNTCPSVLLGEAAADFSESGCSPEEAVSNLLEALRGVAEAADAIAEQVQEPAWAGAGLPPVGIEIEALMPRLGSSRFWQLAKVVHGPIEGAPGEVLVYSLETTRPAWVDEFRPIRTPEQIAAEKREEAARQMSELTQGAHNWMEAFGMLHDAGYRKTEAP